MSSTYSEPLKSGGVLWISSKTWGIRYYLTNKTKRKGYKGKFFVVSGKLIDNYIRAWKSYYDGYLGLLRDFPNDAVITIGDLGLSYGTGTMGGVFIENPKDLSCYMRVTSREELNQLISDYEYAKRKVRKVQGTLRNKF